MPGAVKKASSKKRAGPAKGKAKVRKGRGARVGQEPPSECRGVAPVLTTPSPPTPSLSQPATPSSSSEESDSDSDVAAATPAKVSSTELGKASGAGGGGARSRRPPLCPPLPCPL